MGRKKSQVPQLRHHRTQGRAYALDPSTGKQVYFGPWGLAETQRAYLAWLAEVSARAAEVAPPPPPPGGILIRDLVSAYLDWARSYYVKGDRPTSEVGCIQAALLPVVDLHGGLRAADYAPGHLKAVRQAYIERPQVRRRTVRQADGTTRVEEYTRAVGYPRDTVNKMVQRVRRMFRWAVEHELVPPTTLMGLEAVKDLAPGRSQARESADVEPVPEADLHATLAVLGERYVVLVRLQILLSCRPDELLSMRPCDLDRSATPWLYRPEAHKTEHHGRARTIHVGPQARALLMPLLEGVEADAPVFASRGRGHRRPYRGRLTVSGYRLAVTRACKRAKVPHWFPAQLRHNGLTLVRRAAGIEAAQAVGGHAEIETTQIYAERLDGLARDVIERIG